MGSHTPLNCRKLIKRKTIINNNPRGMSHILLHHSRILHPHIRRATQKNFLCTGIFGNHCFHLVYYILVLCSGFKQSNNSCGRKIFGDYASIDKVITCKFLFDSGNIFSSPWNHFHGRINGHCVILTADIFQFKDRHYPFYAFDVLHILREMLYTFQRLVVYDIIRLYDNHHHIRSSKHLFYLFLVHTGRQMLRQIGKQVGIKTCILHLKAHEGCQCKKEHDDRPAVSYHKFS